MTEKRPELRLTKEHLTLAWCVIMVGFLAAQISVGRFGASYVVVFLLASTITGLLVLTFMKWLRHLASSDEISKKVQRFRREVRSLSIEEAKRRVQALLSDPQRFRCKAADVARSDALSQLAPGLQELFRQYGTIETIRGELKLSSQGLGPSQVKSGYLKVGSNAEHVEVAVKPGEEAVYELDDAMPRDQEQQEEDSFASIYHYLLMESRLLFEE